MNPEIQNLPWKIARKIEQTENGCWFWRGIVKKNGYTWRAYNRKPGPAHRIVYRLLVGPIPDGLCLDHLCRNRSCVNPTHLEPVTHAVNMARTRHQAVH